MVMMTTYDADGRPSQYRIPGTAAAEPPRVPTLIGLDLGQRQDPSALATIEQHRDGDEPSRYKVRRLKRWLGVPYPAIVDELASRLPAWGMTSRDTLVVDETGVGVAVVDLLRRARLPTGFVPMTITVGLAATRTPAGGWHVPKKDLVAVVTVLLEQRRLEVAEGLPETPTLTRELENFRTKVTAAANDVYGVWKASTTTWSWRWRWPVGTASTPRRAGSGEATVSDRAAEARRLSVAPRAAAERRCPLGVGA